MRIAMRRPCGVWPAGELHWVKSNVQRHHAAAEAKGVRVVHCCGYDSVPSDLGALMLVEHARTKHGR